MLPATEDGCAAASGAGRRGAPVAKGSLELPAPGGSPQFQQHEATSGHDQTVLQGHLAMNKEHFRAMLWTNT